jgi:hypothetical protein
MVSEDLAKTAISTIPVVYGLKIVSDITTGKIIKKKKMKSMKYTRIKLF